MSQWKILLDPETRAAFLFDAVTDEPVEVTGEVARILQAAPALARACEMAYHLLDDINDTGGLTGGGEGVLVQLRKALDAAEVV